MRWTFLEVFAAFSMALGSVAAGQAAPAPKDGAEFHAALLEIASAYQEWDRLNETSRWAPTLCWTPPAIGAEVSTSKDKDTHGQKLYFLFAKDPGAYLALGVPKPQTSLFPPAPDLKTRRAEQVIVKESWLPKEVEAGQAAEVVKDATRRGRVTGYLPYARKDGKVYHASERAALFVMLKLDAKTPGTDEGWVYGTLAPDGKSVTSAGKIPSCMECHQSAPHGRLFGIPKDKGKE